MKIKKKRKCVNCKVIIEDDFSWSRVCRDCYELRQNANVSCAKCSNNLPKKRMKSIILSFKSGKRDKKYDVLYCLPCFELVLKKVSGVCVEQMREIRKTLSDGKNTK